MSQLAKISKNINDTYSIVSGIGKNLQMCQNRPPDRAGKLKSLTIIDIKLSQPSWTVLANGLRESRTLEALKLNMLHIDRQALTVISDAMKINSSVTKLDLSYNDISDSNGDVLARIISNQTQNRDNLKWKNDLRRLQLPPQGESSKNGQRKARTGGDVKGLKELYLVQNKLGAFFIKCMLDALKFDDYIRVIDLRKNRLTK